MRPVLGHRVAATIRIRHLSLVVEAEALDDLGAQLKLAVLREHASILAVLLVRRQLVVVICQPLQFVMLLLKRLLFVEYLHFSEPTELLALLLQQVEEDEVVLSIVLVH